MDETCDSCPSRHEVVWCPALGKWLCANCKWQAVEALFRSMPVTPLPQREVPA